jgi:putative ABC transport system permease protein
VLSYRTWERLFGDDPGILQRTIELDKKPYRIIGVMPPDFRWPLEADLWIPIGLPASEYGPGNRLNENYFVIARLAPGVSHARAASFVRGLSNRVLDQAP